MEIKYNDKPITIKTIEIDGKKMTKQLLQQFELKSLLYKHIEEKSYRDINNLINVSDSEFKEYEKCAQIIGWFNLKLEKESEIKTYLMESFHSSTSFMYFDTDVYTVLFINDRNPTVIRRTYMTKVNYNKMYFNQYPQLFI
jgi:hypothetical protein